MAAAKKANFKIENIAIIDSVFKRLNFECMFDYRSNQSMILSIMSKGQQVVEATRENDKPLYIFSFKRGIKLTPPNDKDFTVMLVEAVFEASYGLTSGKPTPQELETFMDNNVKDDTFKIWADFVNSACKLMDISPIPIDQLK